MSKNKVEFKVSEDELKEWADLVTDVKSRAKQGDKDARELVLRLHHKDSSEVKLAKKIRQLLNDLNKDNITPEIKTKLGLDGFSKETWAMLKLMTHEEFGKGLIERCIIAEDYIDPKDEKGKRIILCLSPTLSGQYMHCKRMASREGYRLTGALIPKNPTNEGSDDTGSDDDTGSEEVTIGPKTKDEIVKHFLAFVKDTDGDTIHKAIEEIYNTLEQQDKTGTE
tara:strand:+ start:545 stop:1216 length:672 start_codon:yes stop_codon:yes gene_type:complete